MTTLQYLRARQNAGSYHNATDSLHIRLFLEEEDEVVLLTTRHPHICGKKTPKVEPKKEQS